MQSENENANGKSTALALPTDAELNALQDAARDLAPSDLVGMPLKFVKGTWYSGKGDSSEEISAEEEFVVDPFSYTEVWIKWVNKKPVLKIGGRRIDGFTAPPRNVLPDQDERLWPVGKNGPEDPWQLSQMILLRDESGGLYTFSTASYGGGKAIGEVLDAYATEQRKARTGKMPKVVLSSRDRISADYGKIPEPVFKIVGQEEFGEGRTPPADPARGNNARQAIADLSRPEPKLITAQGTAQGSKALVRGDLDDEIPF
jgi:hypothetical protein